MAYGRRTSPREIRIVNKKFGHCEICKVDCLPGHGTAIKPADSNNWYCYCDKHSPKDPEQEKV